MTSLLFTLFLFAATKQNCPHHETYTRFCEVGEKNAPTTFTVFVSECPKDNKACIVEPLYITEKDIPPKNNYLVIKNDKKEINLKLNTMDPGPSCAGVWFYEKLAWIGNETVLTSSGPINVKDAFKETWHSGNFDSSYSTYIKNKAGKVLFKSLQNLEVTEFFVKENKIARKVDYKCIAIESMYKIVDWCKKEFSFSKTIKQEVKDSEQIFIYRTKDDSYEFIKEYKPSC